MAAKKAQSNSKPTESKKSGREVLPSFPVAGGLRLAGKLAVITGGTRGIGFAIARAFVREGCGVVVTGRHKPRLAETRLELLTQKPSATNGAVMTVPCDVRGEVDVTKLFGHVAGAFGSMDLLVNNAGISHTMTPVASTSLSLWQEVLATNLTSMFLCSREALPLMKPGGTIINMISVAAKRNFVNFAAYNASKAGALVFTRTLREELIPRGIRVVALVLGATNTEIWQQFWPDAPRRRMIDVESVAQAALYAALLPPQANLSELILEPTSGSL